MKKLFTLLLVIAFAFTLSANSVFAFSQDETSLADTSFLEFISSELTDEEMSTLTYTKSNLYNLNLELSGCEINFSFDNHNGFALLSKITLGEQEIFEVQEIYLDKVSPFATASGIKIYPAPFSYISYANGDYKNTVNNETLTDSQLEILSSKGFRYCGTGDYTSVDDRINFHHKNIEYYTIPYDLPTYITVSGASSCAIAAGTNALGYYDRFYENLIPNYQTYISYQGYVLYTGASASTDQVQYSLYDLTDTDVGGAGTTFTGFVNGMDEYVTGQGYNFSYNSLMSWGNFNFDGYKTAVQNGKPVTIFLMDFSLVAMGSFVEGDTEDRFMQMNYPANHVVVGCGYRVITYYDANNNQIAQRKFLRVSSGLDAFDLCYLNISSYTNISNAISFNIS